MAIISWEAFKEATDNNSIVKRSRGPQIERVDDALKAYWSGSKGNVQNHVLLLHGIIDACLGWLKKKEGKAIVTKGLFGKRVENKIFEKRKKAISGLANSALYDLNELLLIHNLYTPDNRGKINFNNNKLRTLGMHGLGGQTGRAGQLKSLSTGYEHERTTYLNEKKLTGNKVAISANQAHDMYKKLHQPSNINIPEQFVGGRKQEQYVNRMQTAMGKDINNLSADDFKLLDELGRLNGMTKNFDFIAKQNRYQFMAIPGPDGKLYDYEDKLITTQDFYKENTRLHMYAMDKYGNLIHKIEGGLVQGLGVRENRFNHSSFNAGGNVICAGMLKIEAGYLTELNTNSGHYKPSRANLHRCVQVLAADGVDFSRLRVTVLEFVTVAGQHFIDWKAYDGTAFLNNPNGAPLLEENRTAA
jgi:hypothetical protein